MNDLITVKKIFSSSSKQHRSILDKKQEREENTMSDDTIKDKNQGKNEKSITVTRILTSRPCGSDRKYQKEQAFVLEAWENRNHWNSVLIPGQSINLPREWLEDTAAVVTPDTPHDAYIRHRHKLSRYGKQQREEENLVIEDDRYNTEYRRLKNEMRLVCSAARGTDFSSSPIENKLPVPMPFDIQKDQLDDLKNSIAFPKDNGNKCLLVCTAFGVRAFSRDWDWSMIVSEEEMPPLAKEWLRKHFFLILDTECIEAREDIPGRSSHTKTIYRVNEMSGFGNTSMTQTRFENRFMEWCKSVLVEFTPLIQEKITIIHKEGFDCEHFPEMLSRITNLHSTMGEHRYAITPTLSISIDGIILVDKDAHYMTSHNSAERNNNTDLTTSSTISDSGIIHLRRFKFEPTADLVLSLLSSSSLGYRRARNDSSTTTFSLSCRFPRCRWPKPKFPDTEIEDGEGEFFKFVPQSDVAVFGYAILSGDTATMNKQIRAHFIKKSHQSTSESASSLVLGAITTLTSHSINLNDPSLNYFKPIEPLYSPFPHHPVDPKFDECRPLYALAYLNVEKGQWVIKSLLSSSKNVMDGKKIDGEGELDEEEEDSVPSSSSTLLAQLYRASCSSYREVFDHYFCRLSNRKCVPPPVVVRICGINPRNEVTIAYSIPLTLDSNQNIHEILVNRYDSLTSVEQESFLSKRSKIVEVSWHNLKFGVGNPRLDKKITGANSHTTVLWSLQSALCVTLADVILSMQPRPVLSKSVLLEPLPTEGMNELPEDIQSSAHEAGISALMNASGTMDEEAASTSKKKRKTSVKKPKKDQEKDQKRREKKERKEREKKEKKEQKEREKREKKEQKREQKEREKREKREKKEQKKKMKSAKGKKSKASKKDAESIENPTIVSDQGKEKSKKRKRKDSEKSTDEPTKKKRRKSKQKDETEEERQARKQKKAEKKKEKETKKANEAKKQQQELDVEENSSKEETFRAEMTESSNITSDNSDDGEKIISTSSKEETVSKKRNRSISESTTIAKKPKV